MHPIIERTVKNVIVVVIAIEIALLFDLMYPTSAGIIAMLGIWNTRRKAWKIGRNRFIGGIIAILISGFAYQTFGYRPLSLGLFLAMYLPLSVYLKSETSIISNTVLSSHILFYGAFDFTIIANEMALLTIGVLIGFVAMIYSYSDIEKIENGKIAIDNAYKAILLEMSESLKNIRPIDRTSIDLFTLERDIKELRIMGREYNDNVFNNSTKNYVPYFDMRLQQIYRLMMMDEQFEGIFITERGSATLSQLTEDVAHWIINPRKRFNTNRFNELMAFYRQAPLPESRDEFENRARFFAYFNNLKIFVNITNRTLD